MKEYSLLKSLTFIALVLLLGLFSVNSYAQFAGGTGTPLDPYLIETAEQLNSVRNYPTNHFRQTGEIDLSPDLLQGTEWYDMELGWLPIGTEREGGFRGSYDGSHFIISNITINRLMETNIGLFGFTSGANLFNICIDNPNIRGNQKIGAIAGATNGGKIWQCSVENGFVSAVKFVGSLVGETTATEVDYCYATTDIIESYETVGGLIGYLGPSSFLRNSYAVSFIEAKPLASRELAYYNRYIGGLVGFCTGATIIKCYATGWMETNSRVVGGIVGQVQAPVNIFNTYWNTESSGRATGGTNVPATLARNTTQMLQQDNYNEWDFQNVWAISEGTYPFLRWQGDVPERYIYPGPNRLAATSGAGFNDLRWEAPTVGEPQTYNIYRNGILLDSVEHPTVEYNDENVVNYQSYQYYVSIVYPEDVHSGPSNKVLAIPYFFAGGSGTEEDPYLIETVDQLNLGVRTNLSLHYRQISHLDLGEISNWNPLGTRHVQEAIQERFRGSYDGNGFTISNLSINQSGCYLGLFGYIDNGLLKNITMENVTITSAQRYTGGLVGYILNGQVTDCSVTGNLTSTYSPSQLGGLAGSMERGIVNNSFFSGIVQGFISVGGLLGETYRQESIVTNCYSTGEVIGTNNVGGLIGSRVSTTGDVRNSYSTANVTGVQDVGGLIGRTQTGDTFYSYSTGLVRGTGASVGGFAGSYPEAPTVTSCYWNVETSQQEESPRGVSLTTMQMLQQDSFDGWDFENIWGIRNGSTYPYLRWQETPGTHNTPAPNLLVSESGNSIVRLDWQPPYTLVPISYKIFKNGVYLQSVNHPNTEFIDDQVLNFVTYAYFVTAVYENNVESGSSNITYATPFAFNDGDGTEDNPYQVSTAEQLNHVRHSLGAHYIQIADIDLGVEPWNVGEGWVPIGNLSSGFSGKFDGNGFIISNLTVERFGLSDYQGLFGYIVNAYLTNIGLENVWIRGTNYVGGIAARAEGSTVTNCYVTGELRTSAFRCGGLIANMSNTTVSQCYSSATIRGRYYAGGLVDTALNESVIINSYSTGSVYGSGVCGGFVGGLHAPATIINSFSTGRLIWDGAAQSYGGLVGGTSGAPPVGEAVNSYWNIETSTHTKTAAGFGLVTSDMVQSASFEEWDFNEVWNIEEGGSYPYLRWQEGPVYPEYIPPSNLRGSCGNNQVNLFWNAPTFGEPDRYNIYAGGTQLASVPAILTETEIAGLTNYSSYIFTITAVYEGVESIPCARTHLIPFPGFAGGAGTEENPYLIATATQLQDINIKDDNNYRGKFYRQIDNIDLSIYENWTPIGEYITSANVPHGAFFGYYDGNGLTISNLSITTTTNAVGLFACIEGATLLNINLVDIDVSGSGNYKGGLAGVADFYNVRNGLPRGIIDNCNISGSITSTGQFTGGLFGFAGLTTVANCIADVNITTTSTFSGGLIANVQGESIVIDCSASGNVQSSNQLAGGLIGRLTAPVTVTRCFATGNVSVGSMNAGGLIAQLTGAGIQISDSFARGNVSGPRTIGGLVGHQGSGRITNCYSTGLISSENQLDIGGLVGGMSEGGITVNSYWDLETSGTQVSASGLPMFTRQMKYPYDQFNTYIEWNFDEIWVADSDYEEDVNPGVNNGYPYLQWRPIAILDTPVVRISFNEDNQSVLSWVGIEDANSYKIYASLDAYANFREWELIGIVGATQYIDTSETVTMKYYRVVASPDDPERGQRGYTPKLIPDSQNTNRETRKQSGEIRSNNTRTRALMKE